MSFIHSSLELFFPHFTVEGTEDCLMTCPNFPSLLMIDSEALGSKLYKFCTLISS